MRRIAHCIAFVALIAFQAAAKGQPVEPGKEGALAELVAPKHKARACYKRTYDAAHLKAHPWQRVTEAEFRLAYYEHETVPERPQGQRNYYFDFRVKLRGRVKMLTSGGECTLRADGKIFCGVDCDGGGVGLRRIDADSVLIDLTDGRIRMGDCDGDADGENAIDMTPGADDKTFKLGKVPATVCPDYDTW